MRDRKRGRKLTESSKEVDNHKEKDILTGSKLTGRRIEKWTGLMITDRQIDKRAIKRSDKRTN